MSEIKALGMMRKAAKGDFPGSTGNVMANARVLFGCKTDEEAFNAIADRVEAEIAERYTERPVDADGVPILIGDVVAAQDEQSFKVRAFQYDVLGWFAIERLGSQWNVNQLHHVKPRTLEDVLTEMLDRNSDGIGLREFNGDFAAFVEHYADEIRDLLGYGECEDEGGIDANGQQVFNCSECRCVLSLYDSDGMNTLCTRFVHDYPRF